MNMFKVAPGKLSSFRSFQRNPLAIDAHFEFTLVVTYAFPAPLLEPLVKPGLALDRADDLGFVACAFVQTRDLRPAGMPQAMGRDFFLTGYRLFVHHQARPSLRGLQILRSDTDSRLMVGLGNLLTRYRYRYARINHRRADGRLELSVQTEDSTADVELVADVGSRPSPLPPGSPFPSLAAARRFQGPLPCTFGYEAMDHSLVLVRARRTHWTPEPVAVDVRRMSFFDRSPFVGGGGRLANAFFVEDVDYGWGRGHSEAVA